MITLYHFEISGNCHKIRLMLSLLGLDYKSVILKVGEHKSPSFLRLNPLGQVPVLVDEDVLIRDSHAILVYLARQYGGETWLPNDAKSMSQVMQWLSTAANDVRQSFEPARWYYLFNRSQVDVAAAQTKAYALLDVIDAHLTERQWLELDRPTIADIACFPYIGLAADGQISLDNYPHVISWINCTKQLSGYVSMPGL